MVVVGGFYQVNQSLRWFVDNFALLAEWRAALSRVIKFREVLLMSKSGCKDAIRTIRLRDFPDHLKSRNSAVPKGKNALLNVIELDVARRGVRSMLPVAREARRRSPSNCQRDLLRGWADPLPAYPVRRS